MGVTKSKGGLTQQLSLSARPKTLDGLFGQEKLVSAIRGHFKSRRYPKAWLFSGPRGTGKTTTAKILSLAYNCEHQKIFGRPCLACRRAKSSFQIYEINASEVTTKDELRTLLHGADYGVMGDGGYRVYILDECHRMSEGAQNLLLKYLEETPRTTVFILCSTEPHNLLDTIRDRCLCYEFQRLTPDGIEAYVEHLMDKIQSKLPADRLTIALMEGNVAGHRQIAMAVEKYVAGATPEDAARVDVTVEVDTRALTRALVSGDWPATARWLNASDVGQMRAIRVGVVSYLATVLLEEPETGTKRTEATAKALERICAVSNAENKVLRGALAAALYQLAVVFSKYRPG